MKRALFVVLALFLSKSAFAVPVTFISTQSDWEYTFIDEIGPGNNAASWDSVDYSTYLDRTSSSVWNTGTAGFGNSSMFGITSPDYNTFWAVNTDIAIRQTFVLNGLADDLLLNVAVDNGYAAFLNGTMIGRANAGGYTSLAGYPNPTNWEYSVSVDTSLLVQGNNELVVLGEDYGGLTFLDVMLSSSNVEPTSVPAPGTLALFGLGLLGLWSTRRKMNARPSWMLHFKHAM